MLASLLAASSAVAAASCRDAALPLTATVRRTPPAITLRWTASAPHIRGFLLYRKALDADSWGPPLAERPGTASAFADVQVVPGTAYEYALHAIGPTGAVAAGYLAAAIEAPLVENRGRLLLLVDHATAAALDAELRRLARDLAGDGWTVCRHDVPAAARPPDIKARIAAEAAATNTGTLRAVLLFGAIAVPRSGWHVIDGHTNAIQAQPADVYYADLTGAWTDATVSQRTARAANVPGDGWFDQDRLPDGAALLALGRVDCRDLPAFGRPETVLLRQYLDANHRYRHRHVEVRPEARIADGFGVRGGEPFAADGWRNFSALLGPDRVAPRPWRDQADLPCLWAGGWGAGGMESCAGVITTPELAQGARTAVFTLLFGSYFGDWSGRNNLIRAVLATGRYGLTCGWAGRPHWYLHRMALGEPIGESVRLTQMNDGARYAPPGRWARGVHVALMGDPTLRAPMIAPPSGLRLDHDGTTTVLTWAASADHVLGYYVYRGTAEQGPFERLVPGLLTETRTPLPPVPADTLLMVRAVALTTTPGGTFTNASQGMGLRYEPGRQPPATVAGLRASDPAPNRPLSLSWNPVSTADDYEVWRSAPGAAPERMIGESRTSPFEDAEAEPLADYHYRVRARHASGTGVFSMPATGRRGIPLPFAPLPLAAAATSTSQVALAWQPVPWADGYRIWRGTNAAFAAATAIGTAAGTNFTDAARPTGPLFYWVQATNEAGARSPSAFLRLADPAPRPAAGPATNTAPGPASAGTPPTARP